MMPVGKEKQEREENRREDLNCDGDKEIMGEKIEI